MCVSNALAMVAYDVGPNLEASAHCLFQRDIACECWSLWVWSRTLPMRTESAPQIHLLLKCFHPWIFLTNTLHTLHFNFSLSSCISPFQCSSPATSWSGILFPLHKGFMNDTLFVLCLILCVMMPLHANSTRATNSKTTLCTWYIGPATETEHMILWSAVLIKCTENGQQLHVLLNSVFARQKIYQPKEKISPPFGGFLVKV